jgi:hypothetical protein
MRGEKMRGEKKRNGRKGVSHDEVLALATHNRRNVWANNARRRERK